MWREPRRAVVVVGLVLAVWAIGCTTRTHPPLHPAEVTGTALAGKAASSVPSLRPLSPATSVSLPTTTTPSLVAWSGPVEHLFFHTLVIDSSLAFANDKEGQGFRDYFVTVQEFRTILDQLYANGWTLVDLHRVVAGTVRVPAGRRPLVISEDDVNYYNYERPRGLGWRLALDPTGDVKVEVHDATGVHITDDDLVPLIDEFVAAHPDFSADGAKGVLALTGYEGLFGERVQDPNAPGYAASVARATAIAERLKATGWLLASHSYGHIDLSQTSTAYAQIDTQRWRAEAEPIIGPTDIYVYPFGARPPPRTLAMLSKAGFSIFCDIDVVPRLTHLAGVTIMSRRHIDGLALTQQAARLAPLFDARAVLDRIARRQ